MTKHFLGAAAALALMASDALAEPGLVIDLGGKFDKSFNESAFTGAQRWAEETGGDYRETELQSEAQREQSMRRMGRVGRQPRGGAGLRQRLHAGEGRARLSRDELRHHRRGGGPAQRAVDRVHRARGLLPRGHAWPRWPPRRAR